MRVGSEENASLYFTARCGGPFLWVRFMKHKINGKPDPNFKADPNYVMVFDEEKRVYRRVHVDDLPEAKKATESFNVNIVHH